MRGDEPPAVELAPPRPEWVIAAAAGAVIAILLAAVVAWRMSDTSLLPTVDSLGGPDDIDSVAPLPPPPPIEVPAEIEVDPEGSAEPAGSAEPELLDDDDENEGEEDVDEPEGKGAASAEGWDSAR